jgi:hypothetical protein
MFGQSHGAKLAKVFGVPDLSDKALDSAKKPAPVPPPQLKRQLSDKKTEVAPVVKKVKPAPLPAKLSLTDHGPGVCSHLEKETAKIEGFHSFRHLPPVTVNLNVYLNKQAMVENNNVIFVSNDEYYSWRDVTSIRGVACIVNASRSKAITSRKMYFRGMDYEDSNADKPVRCSRKLKETVKKSGDTDIIVIYTRLVMPGDGHANVLIFTPERKVHRFEPHGRSSVTKIYDTKLVDQRLRQYVRETFPNYTYVGQDWWPQEKGWQWRECIDRDFTEVPKIKSVDGRLLEQKGFCGVHCMMYMFMLAYHPNITEPYYYMGDDATQIALRVRGFQNFCKKFKDSGPVPDIMKTIREQNKQSKEFRKKYMNWGKK